MNTFIDKMFDDISNIISPLPSTRNQNSTNKTTQSQIIIQHNTNLIHSTQNASQEFSLSSPAVNKTPINQNTNNISEPHEVFQNNNTNTTKLTDVRSKLRPRLDSKSAVHQNK